MRKREDPVETRLQIEKESNRGPLISSATVQIDPEPAI